MLFNVFLLINYYHFVKQQSLTPADADKIIQTAIDSNMMLNHKGEDMRPTEHSNDSKVPVQKIIDNYQKNEWLKTLESRSNLDLYKLEFIKKEIEYDYKPFSILAGGLMRDW